MQTRRKKNIYINAFQSGKHQGAKKQKPQNALGVYSYAHTPTQISDLYLIVS